MAFITVTVTNLKETEAGLKALEVKMHDFGTAMVAIGHALSDYFSNDVFESEGGALGKRWVSLSPKYEEWKRSHYDGRLILEQTGTMRKSFTSEPDLTSVFVTNKATTRSGKSLFAIHQLGTSGGAGRGHNIPARPMIGINEGVRSIIAQIIDADIKAKIESA
jgi:phage gpG-like protein